MPFTVLPALIPDITDVYNVYFAAFAQDPITHALFPETTLEEMANPESEFRKSHTTHTLSYWHTSSTQYTLKCITTNPSTSPSASSTSPKTTSTIGMALLDIYTTPSPWTPPTTLSWLSTSHETRALSLLNPLWTLRNRFWKNERYIYVHVMAVQPEYQRKGVGKLLMEEAMRVARQAGLPVYLEATRVGRGLYEKLGFREIKEGVIRSGEGGEEVVGMAWVPEGVDAELPEGVELI